MSGAAEQSKHLTSLSFWLWSVFAACLSVDEFPQLTVWMFAVTTGVRLSCQELSSPAPTCPLCKRSHTAHILPLIDPLSLNITLCPKMELRGSARRIY